MGLAQDIAQTILDGFDTHYRLFRQISGGAKARFENADWLGAREASKSRIQMYDQRVKEAVAALEKRFPKSSDNEALWPQIKLAYIGLLYKHRQPECAETFFNSVACRVLHRRYYNNEYIFWRPAVSTEHLDGNNPTYLCYYFLDEGLREALEDILHSFGLRNPFQNLPRDLDHLLRVLEESLPPPSDRQRNFQIQVLSSLFYRNKAAYVVGRILNGSNILPIVIPILQDENGQLFLDTVLFDRRDVGRVFSLVRAYFMVDMEVPSAYVAFLESLIPSKPRAELYTLLGLQKQGKTLAYRDLQQHLKHSTDNFELAPGTKGMVMVVFALPSYPYVFKVIRDKFEPPKNTDVRHVQDRYLLVKYHDRVGRMADTLEYSHVAFPKSRFDPVLLEELERLAPSRLEHDGDWLVIKHLYLERCLVPLDIYLRDANEKRVREAIREYGNAIKDLIGVNIFPGDLLLKNFGITRYGRVVFYDYDEICYLTECNFRRLPTPSHDEDTYTAEPWFAVGPHDIFPEEFPTFVVPEGKPREIFFEYHKELADPAFWIEWQEKVRMGIQADIFPYPESMRFCHRFS